MGDHGYATLQFHRGGLFDAEPVETVVHLVRRATSGATPGPTLCGLDRFAPESPGWSVGGGISGDYEPCQWCDEERDASLAVTGMHRSLFP